MATDDRKRTNLYVILSGIFLTNAIVAEMIGVKIFSLEALMGIPPLEIRLLGGDSFGFNLTAGVLLWPVVFVTSDIINEYFGKEGVRKISYLTAIFIAYMFVLIYLATELPPAAFWLEVNNRDAEGNFFNINSAFAILFRQGLGIIIGSLVAFLIGQLLDVWVFHRLRRITGSKHIWLRATGSTLVSQFVDSFVVLGIAFYVFGNWSIAMVVSVGIVNYLYKFTVAILLTPILYIAHYLIDNYLGKHQSEIITEKAAASSKGFF